MNSFIKMIQSNDLLKVALILLGVYAFIFFFNRYNIQVVEKLEDTPAEDSAEAPAVPEQPAVPSEPQTSFQPQNTDNADASFAPSNAATSVGEDKTKLQADDLLPKYDDANDFAKQNPVSQLLKEQNFLISGYHVGVNTVLQSNKIPYHDLRSAPPVPKEYTGPWSQSSYSEPMGSNRKLLEIL